MHPLKTIVRMSIMPEIIYCQPEGEDGTKLPQHNFRATKVYVLIDEYGSRQDGIVICPDHNQPISVNIKRKPRDEGVF